MSGFDVIVCGSLHLDIIVRAPRLPVLDETAVGSAWTFACGGKGRNQAAQAAAAGARVAMIGRVGRDDFGARLLASLDAADVDRREIVEDASTGSGMSVAILNGEGGYGAVIVSGANLVVRPEDAAEAFGRLGGAGVLVLQNEIPEAVNRAVARAARAHGARVILNAAPARPISDELSAFIDVLVVNRVEAEQAAGFAVTDAQSAAASAKRLSAGHRAVVVTRGGDGLVLVTSDLDEVHIAAEPVAVVTTHGAGDCFVGALAARLAAGESLQAGCRFASVAAARLVAGQSRDKPG